MPVMQIAVAPAPFEARQDVGDREKKRGAGPSLPKSQSGGHISKRAGNGRDQNRSGSVDSHRSNHDRTQSGRSLARQGSGGGKQNSLQSATSLKSIEGEICRICHCEAEEAMPLIDPCLCMGSLKFVHQECLQKWIKSSNTQNCELCHFNFVMQSKLKPLGKWQKFEMSSGERRKIVCSITFHIVAIICVVWALYVLLDHILNNRKDDASDPNNLGFWTKLIVVAIGFSGGLVFMYVQCKVYVQLWRRLRAYNRVIYVQDCPQDERDKVTRIKKERQQQEEEGTAQNMMPVEVIT